MEKISLVFMLLKIWSVIDYESSRLQELLEDIHSKSIIWYLINC
jgi:hypothetical protein